MIYYMTLNGLTAIHHSNPEIDNFFQIAQAQVPKEKTIIFTTA